MKKAGNEHRYFKVETKKSLSHYFPRLSLILYIVLNFKS